MSSSIRHAQLVELFLHWTFNSGDVTRAMAPEYLQALEEMTRDLDASVPTAEECSPEGIRARLQQHANILEEEKKGMCTALGINPSVPPASP
jgi:hypothetical protein